MMDLSLRLKPGKWLLPRKDTDLTAWACVACDQYTSQPEYWDKARALVGGKPSALKLILPEADLSKAEELIPGIQAEMQQYLDTGVLRPMEAEGFLLTERTTESGVRVGLLALLDLEGYDYRAGSQSLIRPTEGTIVERIPPRLKVRRGAALELSHVMMLLDDPSRSVLEPLHKRRATLSKVYDFPLMLGGGHLTGYGVTAPEDIAGVYEALGALRDSLSGEAPLLYAVGDGNHSLATAKAHWEELKPSLPPAQRETHPARYAMAEIINLHSPALAFEPIHRVLFGVTPEEVLAELAEYAATQGLDKGSEEIPCVYQWQETRVSLPVPPQTLAVAALQAFLDAWLPTRPEVTLDYVHGEDAVRALAVQDKALGFLLPPPDKASLFPTVMKEGALPRKTFSMGEAHEKRYYMEARALA